jgi:hypothetical protein
MAAWLSKEQTMSVRVGQSGTGTDRSILAVAVLAGVVVAAGMLWLAQATLFGERFDTRTVRVDNQAGLPVQIDAIDADGDRLGLGEARPRTTTTFVEVADLGTPWTFVASYGGRELTRQTLSGQELADRGWTVQVPAVATAELERQGYR